MPIKTIFFGTAEIAVPSLKALAASPEFVVALVVSQPGKPAGREMKLQPTAVKKAAMELGLPVEQPLKAREPGFQDLLRRLEPDLAVVMAYGQILPQSLLDIPRFGCLNLHTSILPRYRGAAPIQWALINGDAETGVSLMKMDAGMDTGPVLSVSRTALTAEDHAGTVHDRLGLLAAGMIVRDAVRYVHGDLRPEPQPEGATHAAKISKDDGRIDWRLDALVLANRLRAFTPWPGLFTHLPTASKSILLKVISAAPEPIDGAPGEVLEADSTGVLVACGKGSLRITALQKEGGKRLPASDFLRGNPIARGVRLE